MPEVNERQLSSKGGDLKIKILDNSFEQSEEDVDYND